MMFSIFKKKEHDPWHKRYPDERWEKIPIDLRFRLVEIDNIRRYIGRPNPGIGIEEVLTKKELESLEE